MSIGSNIRELREFHGLTQEEFGRIAGVSDKAVSTWENDIKIPRMGSLQRIADHFKINKGDITDGPIFDRLKKAPEGNEPTEEQFKELKFIYEKLSPEAQEEVKKYAYVLRGKEEFQRNK